jgi:hypothetical protein
MIAWVHGSTRSAARLRCGGAVDCPNCADSIDVRDPALGGAERLRPLSRSANAKFAEGIDSE